MVLCNFGWILCKQSVIFRQLLHDTIFKLLHHGLPNSYMHLKFGWLRSWLRACVSNIVIIQFLYCCWGAKNHETIKYFNCCQCYIFVAEIHCTLALDYHVINMIWLHNWIQQIISGDFWIVVAVQLTSMSIGWFDVGMIWFDQIIDLWFWSNSLKSFISLLFAVYQQTAKRRRHKTSGMGAFLLRLPAGGKSTDEINFYFIG